MHVRASGKTKVDFFEYDDQQVDVWGDESGIIKVEYGDFTEKVIMDIFSEKIAHPTDHLAVPYIPPANTMLAVVAAVYAMWSPEDITIEDPVRFEFEESKPGAIY